MTRIGNLMTKLAVTTMVVVASSQAMAADAVSPFYLAAAGGVIFSPLLKSSEGRDKFSTYPGGIGSFAIGTSAGNGFRVELEGLYSAQTLSSIKTRRLNGSFMPIGGLQGQRTTTAVLANIVYDVPIDLPVKPFVGVGAGIGWMNYGGVSGTEPFLIRSGGLPLYEGPATISYDGTTSLAYQLVAGVSWKVPGVSGLELTLQNKLFGLAESTSRAHAFGTNNLYSTPRNATASWNVTTSPISDAVMLGLRYTFNAQQ